MSERSAEDTPPSSDARRDASDLRRSVLLNLIGYAIKVASPVLAWATIYFYGARDYGFFVAGQATIMVTLRSCVLGLDKGVLWWVARQDAQPGQPRFPGLGAALWWVGGAALVAAAGASLLAPVLADWKDEPAAALGIRLMALSILPMALTEVLVGAALGRRSMEAQVLIRDGFIPAATPALALVFFGLGMRLHGLSLAYVIARVLGMFGTLYLMQRKAGLTRSDLRPQALPAPLLRYSLPVWISELSGSFLQRMDVITLTALSTPETVGIYGAVLQVGNAIRSIRGSFDSIVIAIFSEISVRRDYPRLKATFSYATSLVLATQMPVYVAIVLFAEWIMGLLGEGYERGATAVTVVIGFSLWNSAIGMHGHIVRAYGRGSLILVNVLLTLAVQQPLLQWLIPKWGITGAATAVGLTYLFQNSLWLTQAVLITRMWPYDRHVTKVIALGVVSGVSTFLVYEACRVPVGDMPARICAALAFCGVYGLGVWRLLRTGVLTGKPERTAAAG